jgi:hypothetical protein
VRMSQKSAVTAAARKAVALSIVFFFMLQLSRVYLITKIDLFFTCPYTQVWISGNSVAGQTELVMVTLPADDDGSARILQCKDSLDGFSLAPLQPLSLPAATVPTEPRTSYSKRSSVSASVLEACLPPPFQPPRRLS